MRIGVEDELRHLGRFPTACIAREDNDSVGLDDADDFFSVRVGGEFGSHGDHLLVVGFFLLGLLGGLMQPGPFFEIDFFSRSLGFAGFGGCPDV